MGRAGRRGFTIVEVITVVIVLGLLAALAVPRFFASTAMSQMDADANRLFLDMQWARTAATRCQCRIYTVFDTLGTKWAVYKEKSGDLVFDAASDSLIRRDSLGNTVRFGFGSNYGSVPSTAPSAISGFSSTLVPRSGFGVGAASDDCVEGGASGTGSWSGSVVFCGGRAMSDVETGIVYLSTTRSRGRAQAILYNDLSTSGSFQIERWVWTGDSWRRS